MEDLKSGSGNRILPMCLFRTEWFFAATLLLCCGWLSTDGETKPFLPLDENGTDHIVSGSVYIDQNRDGAFGGDLVLTNATVMLMADLDGNGALDLGDYQIGTQLTDSTGQYAFGSVSNGYYLVIELDPLGYVSVTDSGESDPTNDCNTIRVTVEGADRAGNDFLDTPTGVLGSRVWLDENANALSDAGERGIANVRVRLYSSEGTPYDTASTDTEGQYLFHGLSPGLYYVNVLDGTDSDDSGVNTLPTGMTQTPPLLPVQPYGNQDHRLTPVPNRSGVYGHPVLLEAGCTYREARFGYNWTLRENVFGNHGTGALGDRVWSDADGDGHQDPGEPGIGGATATLIYDSDGDGFLNATQTVSTTAEGTYIFNELPAGAYQISFTASAGYLQTGDPDAWVDGRTTHPLLLAPGDVFVNADFGFQPLAGHATSIPVHVWLDVNNDAALDGSDTGLVHVSVALIRDSDADGEWDWNEPIIAATITAPDGSCTFDGISCDDGQGTDDYLVWVNDTAGMLSGLTPRVDPDGLFTPNICAVTDLAPSGAAKQAFGYAVPMQTQETGLIGNLVFLDRNGNGAFEIGEGMENVSVFLYAANGNTLLRITKTDVNGRYVFGDLANGTYIVLVDEESLPGQPDALFNSVDPDQNVLGQSRVTINTESTADLQQDFGYEVLLNPNTIEGAVWNDSNADGHLSGETNGFAGVTLRVSIDGGGVALTVTDATGHYSVSGLPSGACRVDVTDAGNVLDGLWHSLGAPDADNHSQADPYFVAISNGAAYPADFGYYAQGASAGDLVWEDLNANGLQDAGEPGVSNICIELTAIYSSGITNHVKTLTAENGQYVFSNLLLDEQDGDSNATQYVIAPVLPESYRPSPENQGLNDAVDSDPHDGVVAEVVRGECADQYDFGTFLTAVVEGYVFRDDNGDLLRDAGDSAIKNIPVRLVGPPAFGVSTNTDTHGYYRFEWVPPAAVSVLVSRVDATLIEVPVDEPEASDDRRNRALPDASGEDAYIAHTVTSGHGVLPERPSSTLNFGFASYPLSTAIDISLYASANGVMIELWTENEAGREDIVIYAWIGNTWTEVGRIASLMIVGEGSNRYVVQATGLLTGSSYLIRILDEAGHIHCSPTPVPVRELRAQAIGLELKTLKVDFNTEKGHQYAVMASTDLVRWAPEYVSHPTANGWSPLTIEPFTAGNTLTTVRVPLNGRNTAFFKIVLIE